MRVAAFFLFTNFYVFYVIYVYIIIIYFNFKWAPQWGKSWAEAG